MDGQNQVSGFERHQRKRQAFTLIEMLVVLAILGLLLALVAVNFDTIFGRGQEAVSRMFVRDTVKTGLAQYRLDLGAYPSSSEGLEALLSAPSGKTEHWKGPYLDLPGNKLPLDPWGEPYQYTSPGAKNVASYDLFSKGPDKISGTPDDIGNW